MENGVNVTDVGTLAGLRAVGGYGYGGQGNFLGDGSAVKEAVRGNRDIALLEGVNSNAAAASLSNQIRQHNDSISDRIASSENFISTQVRDSSLEFRFSNITAQHAAIERLITANDQRATAAQHALDLKLTECCCELKAGQATIIANRESARLQAAQAENANLRTQIMINNQSRGNSGQGND